jgi:general secretion pathway protein G
MEVLLVLIIIVVIAGLGIQQLMGSFQKSKINAAKATMGLLSNSLKRYQIDVGNGNLPATLDALHEQPADLANPGDWIQMLDKPVPMDPWGKPYEYKPNGTSFELKSGGPDGQIGTQDDVVG